jgi:hypothetical protein
MKIIPAYIGICLLLCPVLAFAQPPLFYEVENHNASSGEWVFIRAEGDKRVRFTAVCASYRWGEHDTVRGKNSCDLRVGQRIVPKWADLKNKRDFVEVFVDSNSLSIVQDDGPHRTIQLFEIKSVQALEK